MAEEFNISEVLNYLKRLLHIDQPKDTPTASPTAPVSVDFKGYQSPIKGSWKNSGDYSPHVATDARHPNGHQGVDMRAPGGTAVYPMAPGTVTNTGVDPKGGNFVSIDHGNTVKTYSAHLGTIKVHHGDQVGYDTIIGTVGDTGNAQGTWPHVHFQVWRGGQLQNPGSFFSVPKYENVDAKKEQKWLPGAKDEAIAWSAKNPQKRVALSQMVDDIHKISSEFYKLAKKL